jgi:hypothetical protein
MKTDLIIPQERRRVHRGEVARIRWNEASVYTADRELRC